MVKQTLPNGDRIEIAFLQFFCKMVLSMFATHRVVVQGQAEARGAGNQIDGAEEHGQAEEGRHHRRLMSGKCPRFSVVPRKSGAIN